MAKIKPKSGFDKNRSNLAKTISSLTVDQSLPIDLHLKAKKKINFDTFLIKKIHGQK